MGYYGVKYIGKQVGVFMLDFDVFNMYPDKILVLQGEVFLLTKEKE